MSVYRPKYRDPKTGKQVQVETWWYSFHFAGKRIRESSKTHLKTLAKEAEAQRKRELQEGFNGVGDNRKERIRSIQEIAAAYLDEYRVRHSSGTFAEYAIGHVVRHAGQMMLVDVTDETIRGYQTARLKEGASPKSVNEEVGFFLRLLGEQGDNIRGKLRRQRALKLRVPRQVGKAFSPEEKAVMLATAREAKSPAIYPALMLALNAGMRDAEIRGLQWGRVDLANGFLTVGDSKTEAGEGRTIPLNSALLEAIVNHAKWYTKRFGTIESDWYVFPAGRPVPKDPTRPITTLKTAWRNVRAKANVRGRWHDNRHTLITDLAESGAGDEVIRDIAGHVSKQMLKHYSHIRMKAKRDALESLVSKTSGHPAQSKPEMAVKEVAKETILN